MIFGREREAVRNATRAIRDLVLRRELGGSGGLGGGLSAMAMMAVAPLRQLPELATQVPGTLRDLGERMTAIPSARRRAPALAFAAQALAGSVRYGATLRERYLNLLAASMDGETAARVHPAFLTVLRQLTPDEVRIISTFQHDGPYPLLTVSARYRFGERLSTELRHFSLLGHPGRAASSPSASRCTSTTCAGWGWRSCGRCASPTTPGCSAPLEAHPQVLAAIARIEARIPELESANPGRTTTATASSRTCSAPRST